MIAKSILAAGAFVSFVAAIPLAGAPMPKRDVVWETHTEVAVTTIPVTVTHWLEPGETPPADSVGQQHFGHKGHGQNRPSPQSQTTQPAAPRPQEDSPETPSQSPPAAAASSYEQPPAVESAPPAPVTPQDAPESTAQQAPPPASPTTQQAPPPANTPQPEPTSPSTSSGGSLEGVGASGQSYTGDLTYYDPGLGACGITSGPGEAIVAIAHSIFDAYDTGNPNNNPLCGKSVTITGEDGSPYTAKIVDRCGGCKKQDLDLSPQFFKKVVPKGDGRVHGVEWKFD